MGAERHAHRRSLTTEPTAHRDRFVPLATAVFAVSLVVRLVHLFEIRRSPLFGVFMGDAQAYHAWAQQIAAGDWIGSGVFYQAPLYPYFLGLVYSLLGESPMTVRLCQAVIGSIACVLLAFAAWHLFSRTAGFVAGLMLALYAPAIFFDGLVQKSVLDAFLVCLALALLSRIITRAAGPRSWLWVGMTLGLLTLSRENALVLAVALLFWVLWRQPDVGSSRLAAATWLVAGLLVVLLPVVVRNKVVGGEFHLTTAQFGPNFYIGNNATASGTYEPLRFGHGDPRFERQDATELAEQATGRPLTPADVSRYWTKRALDYIRSQPGDWLALTGRKFLLASNAAEIADTEDQLSYADWSVVLRIASRWWHFGILAPMALFGMWATWTRRAELAVLYLLTAAYLLGLVAFAVMARYRYPLVPFLILFASAGLAATRGLFGRAPRQLISGFLVIGLSAIFCNMPVYSMARMRSITDTNIATELQAQGKLDEAIALYRAALARDPADALTYSNLGTALKAKGQLSEATAQYRRALDLAPDDADNHYNFANALVAQGRIPEAVEQFREAIRIDPGLTEAHLNLGNALTALGQSDNAANEYRRVLELAPDSVEALNNLGLLLSSTGSINEAIALWRRALAIDPAYADAHSNLASALDQAGASAEALGHLQRVVELMPQSADAHNELGVMLAEQHRIEDAIAHFRNAISLAPELAEAHANLALALQLQGEREQALLQYREAVRLAPADQEMQQRLKAALAAGP